jgi:hypothetical protein
MLAKLKEGQTSYYSQYIVFPSNHLKETINNKNIGLLQSNALRLGV